MNIFSKSTKRAVASPLEFARFSYKPLADNDYNKLLELRDIFTNKIRNIFYKDAVEIIRDNQRKNNIVCIVTSTILLFPSLLLIS